MGYCEDKLNKKTAHFRLPCMAQKRCMFKFPINTRDRGRWLPNKANNYCCNDCPWAGKSNLRLSAYFVDFIDFWNKPRGNGNTVKTK